MIIGIVSHSDQLLASIKTWKGCLIFILKKNILYYFVSDGPYKMRCYLLRGTFYTQMSDIDNAMQDFEKVLELEESEENNKVNIFSQNFILNVIVKINLRWPLQSSIQWL